MTRSIPQMLEGIVGVPSQLLDGLSQATQASAGSAIGQLRDAAPEDPIVAPLGDDCDAIVTNLSAAFAHSAAWSIGFSALFLLLGLLGSLMVLRQSRKGHLH